MVRTCSRRIEWLRTKILADFNFDKEAPKEAEKYKEYVEITERFIRNRNLNESESFDRIGLFNAL